MHALAGQFCQTFITYVVRYHGISLRERFDQVSPNVTSTNDCDFGEGSDTAPQGTLTSVPYDYTLLGSDSVKAAVVGTAGNTLTLG